MGSRMGCEQLENLSVTWLLRRHTKTKSSLFLEELRVMVYAYTTNVYIMREYFWQSPLSIYGASSII